MLALMLAVLAAAPPTLAMPGLGAVNLPEAEVSLHAETLATHLARGGVRLISARDIAAVLGLERQRQVLGCAEQACTAELAAALGAEALVVGDLGRLGSTYALNLKIISAKDGTTLARHEAQVARAEDMPAAMRQSAASLLAQLGQAWHRPELGLAATPAAGADRRWWALAPVGAGVVALAAGAYFELQADDRLARLKALTPPADLKTADALRTEGRSAETTGAVALTAGGLALAAGVAMFFALAPQETGVVAWVTPAGGAVAVSGRFP